MEILKESSEDAEVLYKKDSELKLNEHINTKISFMHRLKTYINNYERSEV